MPFRTIARFGKSIKKRRPADLLREMPGIQTAEDVSSIVLSLIKKRRSIRKYRQQDVSDGLLMEILDAARHAPSEGNSQPWEFIIVRDRTLKGQLVAACYGQTWMIEAPVLIVACINMRIAKAMYGERGEKLYGVQSVAASIENMLIAAESLGLGTCWVGAFAEPQIAILTYCPEYVRPCAIITVGYPEETPPKPHLQGLEEYTHVERFGQSLLVRKVEKEKSPLYVKIK